MLQEQISAAEYAQKMSEGLSLDGSPSIYNLIDLLVAESRSKDTPPDQWNDLINLAGTAIRTFENGYGANRADEFKEQWSLEAVKRFRVNNLEVLEVNEKIDNLDLDFVERLIDKDKISVADFLRLRGSIYDNLGLSDRCKIVGLSDQIAKHFEKVCELTVSQVTATGMLPQATNHVLASVAESWPELLDVQDLVKLEELELLLLNTNGSRHSFDVLLNKLSLGLHDMMGRGMREREKDLAFLSVVQRLESEPSYKV